MCLRVFMYTYLSTMRVSVCVRAIVYLRACVCVVARLLYFPTHEERVVAFANHDAEIDEIWLYFIATFTLLNCQNLKAGDEK